ncbi:OsmC family protein [Marinibacterium sp. SX1]|uniref:OsmC family protein n=1 Tax=Marinibacterium sp. SX1 TaxID=3388424 RepID=UPI003D16A76E
MKNGMNVAAISELVHEIRKVPRENEIDYSAGLTWAGGLTLRGRTLPLRFGSKRLGRDFRFDVGHLSDPDGAAAPTPADYLMVGLGSCVANILVQGASYKGITLDTLRVSAAASQAGAALEGLALDVHIASDGGRWQYKQMMMNVARFSPNYVTVTLPNSLAVDCIVTETAAPGDGLSRPARIMPAPMDQPAGPVALGVDIDWRNGTQMDIALKDIGTPGHTRPRSARLVSDQPGPAAGLNEAPNPQEYLLTGVAADLMQQVVLCAAEEGLVLHALEGDIACHLDMKGCFNLFDKSAIQLQDNRLVLRATGPLTTADLERLVAKARTRSACHQAFAGATKAALERIGD